MEPATNPEPGNQTTVVCCIEQGHLEQQTLLMIETLRRWGGPIGQSRVLAVIPRRGARLAPKTTAALEKFGVEVHDASRFNVLPWYNWYAKVAAAQLAEEVATTPVVVWLDSDALIFDPLIELGLPRGDDVTARRETLPPAVFDEDSSNIEFWKRACEVVGVHWDDVPWLEADGPDRPQRLMVNAGINAFRRGRGFSEAYADCTLRMMRSHVTSANGNFWHNEQNGLMLAVVKAKLRFRELPRSENHMVFDCQIDGPEAAPTVADARLIHYSKSMYAPFWDRFISRIQRERPEHSEWLRQRGPNQKTKIPMTPGSLVRKVYRRMQTKSYLKECDRQNALIASSPTP